MRARRTAVLIGTALLAAAPLAGPAPAAAAASGTLTLYAGPGIGMEELQVTDGCRTFAARAVNYTDLDPIGDYWFFSGPDCTGTVLGGGRDETQWIPPLLGARSVLVDFG
ncbi:hypothetical protein [Nocardiopsis coralliicola]